MERSMTESIVIETSGGSFFSRFVYAKALILSAIVLIRYGEVEIKFIEPPSVTAA